MNSYIIAKNKITMYIDGEVYSAAKATHPNFDDIVVAVTKNEWDKIPGLVNIKQAIQTYSNNVVQIQDGVLYFNGAPLNNALVDRILEFSSRGYPVDNMVEFLKNLMKNPSKTSVDELYLFLEKAELPLTEDGCFLAYKKVRDNFHDIFTGSMDNSPGKVLEVPRNTVDDRRDNTCSYGLHFCSKDYLPNFGAGPGNRVVIVKINPANVVSIPSDYDNTKGRTCRYEVVGEYKEYRSGLSAFDKPLYTNNDIRRSFTDEGCDEDEIDFDLSDDSSDDSYDDWDAWSDDISGYFNRTLDNNHHVTDVTMYMDRVSGEVTRAELKNSFGAEYEVDAFEITEMHDFLSEQVREGYPKARIKVVSDR